MNEKLQKKLYKKYPNIFRQKDLNMKKTCMCWGINVGDGWYTLIDELCRVIKNTMENEKSNAKFQKRKPAPQIEAVQVKEKFGGLRFYTNYCNHFINGAISLAMHMSYNICEECGSTDKVIQTEGWILTLCNKCLKKFKKEAR